MSTTATPRRPFFSRVGWLALLVIGGGLIVFSFLASALVGVLLFGGLLLVAVIAGYFILRAVRRRGVS